MKYLLFVCVDEELVNPESVKDMPRDTIAWVEEMDGRGVRLQGNRLAKLPTATTVRVREGEVVLADGPFAETKEYIAGYDILECADLDEAIEVAGKHPVAKIGAIEVRPFAED
ncbi:MAG TPA: YciI family protein [Solirubrobacteraceae bacterium]|nr:YciI family protein [Solirubrobacteraceae bacterium]